VDGPELGLEGLCLLGGYGFGFEAAGEELGDGQAQELQA
jgi:hypothetical protein